MSVKPSRGIAGRDDVTGLPRDDLRGAEDLLELTDARLVVPLLVLGRVVVGVLADVAVLAGALDPGRDLLAAWPRPFGELLLEAVVGLLRERRCGDLGRLPAAVENKEEPRPETGLFVMLALVEGDVVGFSYRSSRASNRRR